MKLRILEANKDKKGTILEKIICLILSQKGYVITRNEVGAGGNEIDVVAQKKTKASESAGTILICECKAHDNPICMNDWLKFLGKYYKEKRNNPEAKGLMVALSDANGNVKGDVRESHYTDEVELMTGDDLLTAIQIPFQVCNIYEAKAVVGSWCNDVVNDCDIAFFLDNPYWIVYFTDGCYAILDKNGGFPESIIVSGILDLFTSVTTFTKEQYKDIRKDKVLALKRRCIRTVAYWDLMSEDKTAGQIAGDVVSCSGDSIHPEEYEIINCMKNSEFVELIDGKFHLKSFSGVAKTSFYRELLSLGIPIKLYNEYYINNIDEELLNHILQVQDTILLNQEEREIVLFVLKHSPSALRVALSPNMLFAPKVRTDNVDKSALAESIKSTFIQTLSHCLEVDSDSDIAMLLFDKLEIRDFHKQIIYRVVTKDGREIQIPVSKRLYYIPFEDVNGGAVIQASQDFIGHYDPKSGYMIGGKKINQQEKTFFGVVKHKTGESGEEEEYISLFS